MALTAVPIVLAVFKALVEHLIVVVERRCPSLAKKVNNKNKATKVATRTR